MGKRTDLPQTADQKTRDFWPTPPEAMAPLLPHLVRRSTFCEPCAGAGAMVDYFESAGHPCVLATDLQPMRGDISAIPAAELRYVRADQHITNPPWRWEWLHPIIVNLSTQLPTWLLLSADFAHNLQAQDVMARCSKIVPIGRVQWVPGSAHKGGYENAAWYRFDPGHTEGPRIMRRQPKLRGADLNH